MSSWTEVLIVVPLSFGAPVLLVLTPIITVRTLLRASKKPLQAIFVPIAFAVFWTSFFTYIPLLTEDVMNHARIPIAQTHLENAANQTQRFDVIDLHCDALLWGARDFTKTTMHPIFKRRPVGAVDIPRLLRGDVRLQIFAAAFELWPIRTWFSPMQRVFYQFQRLHDAERKTKGQLNIVRSRAQLNHSPFSLPSVQAVLAVEGLSCLENKIGTVDHFYDAGIRVLGPTHFFDTEVGGSLHGTCNCGLTPFGRQVLTRMSELSMIVDLAHASLPLMDDILNLKLSERPPIMLSHTGLDSVCPSGRGLPDEYLKRIAGVGGIIGITLFRPALCGEDLVKSFVTTVVHARSVLDSVDAIALGSDWDGRVFTIISAADTHVLASALLAEGSFSEKDVRKIMYENSFNFLARSLPMQATNPPVERI